MFAKLIASVLFQILSIIDDFGQFSQTITAHVFYSAEQPGEIILIGLGSISVVAVIYQDVFNVTGIQIIGDLLAVSVDAASLILRPLAYKQQVA